MKTYKSEATANAVAAKLSKKGVEHVVIEHNGMWAVAPVEAQVEEQHVPIQTGEDGEPTFVPEYNDAGELMAQTDIPEANDAVEDDVTIVVPGAYITAKYVITPPVGSGKKGAVDRWFELARVKSAASVEGGVSMTLSAKALKSRGIDASQFAAHVAA